MNLNVLTDIELLDYLDKYSDDPLILRLVKMQMPHAEILDDLVNAGAAPDDFSFENCYSPSEYIHHLNNEIEYLNNELSEAQEEATKLKARTVLDLLAELRGQLEVTDIENIRVKRDIRIANEQRDEAQSKLKMWTTLCEQPTMYT